MSILVDSNSATVGTSDAPPVLGRPAVEVIFDAATRRDIAPDPPPTTAARMVAAMTKRAPAPIATPPTAEAVAKVETAPVAADAPPKGDATPDTDAVDAGQPTDAGAAAEKPAEEPAVKSDVAPATVPDDVALHRDRAALLETRVRELEHGHATTRHADRDAYIADPATAFRSWVAGVLGVKADDKIVDEEATHLQKELLLSAIGADTVPDAERWQRHQEHQGREKRLKQHAQDTSRETDGTERAIFDRNAAYVSSVHKAAEKDYPFLALASELGQRPERVALALWLQAVQDGRAKPGADDAESAKEALRLGNEFFKGRAQHFAKLGADTAPTPANAPAQASAKAVDPGAPTQQASTAPPKGGSASPTTLSAKQAAAAPRARVEPTRTSTTIVIDPRDKDAEIERRRRIVTRPR